MHLPLEELKALLWLSRLGWGGAKTIHSFLLEGLSPSKLVAKIETENFFGKAELLAKIRSEFSPEKEIQTAESLGVQFLPLLDPDYPPFLRHIFDPPLVLYVHGKICPEDVSALAIVGPRQPTFYGLHQTQKFTNCLAQSGITIVSGLAQGVDQAAHRAALQISYGRTLAVVGCGLDIDYPAGSRELKQAILKNRGAILSEYGFGMPPRAENFPRRNRIIAGLSLGVLVIEAHTRSGSLITARLANEEGREVFAMPGPVDQLTSRGTHQLIKEGAHLVETPEDILQILAEELQRSRSREYLKAPAVFPSQEIETSKEVAPQRPELTPEEEQVLDCLKTEGMDYEELVSKSQIPPLEMTTLLTFMELKGRITKNPDGRYVAGLN